MVIHVHIILWCIKCICVVRFVSVSDLWEPADNGTNNQVKWQIRIF